MTTNPPDRTYVVPADNRTVAIAVDNRVYVVPDDE